MSCSEGLSPFSATAAAGRELPRFAHPLSQAGVPLHEGIVSAREADRLSGPWHIDAARVSALDLTVSKESC